MKILYFFLFLWVIFPLLDPDPATQINADPKPCRKWKGCQQHTKKPGTEGKPSTVIASAEIPGTGTTTGGPAIVGMRNSRDNCNREETKK
jgi:hypothetical protein